MSARARSSTKAVVAAAIATTWVGIAACELVLPTHELLPGAGAPSASASASARPADTCKHRYVPDAGPTLPDDDNTSAGDLLFAVKTLSFAGDASVGLDLDHTCTCPGPPSCKPPLPGLPESTQCDPSDGRDRKGNMAFGEVMEAVLEQAPSGNIDQRIAIGLLSYLVQIRHYKPGRAAQNVSVAFYDSSGLLGPGPSGILRSPPTWDGGEPWAIDCALSKTSGCPDSGDLIGDAPLIAGFRDSQAYITEDGQLVANLSEVVIGFNLGTLRLTQAVIEARLTTAPDGRVTQLDGQIAGRLTKDDVFATVSMLKTQNGEGKLCPGADGFEAVRTTICQTLDIPSGPEFTSDVCDALSFAIPFTALPARLGYRFDHDPEPRGCDASVSCK